MIKFYDPQGSEKPQEQLVRGDIVVVGKRKMRVAQVTWPEDQPKPPAVAVAAVDLVRG